MPLGVLVAVGAVALVAGVVLGTRAGRAAGIGRTGRWAVLGLTVVIAAALTPYTVEDNGSAAVYLLGVPVVLAAIPVLADLAGVGVRAATAIAAVAMLAWGLILGLGIGGWFLIPALLLGVLATVNPVPAADTSAPSQTTAG